jgi:cytochrome P450
LGPACRSKIVGRTPPHKGAGSDGSAVDLQQILASSLPIAVIGSLVGVPEADWPALRGSMSRLLQLVELSLSTHALAEADDAATKLDAYFAALAAGRRREPRGDLASAMVTATDASRGEAGQFTEDELVQTLTFVFMAGVDTMTNLLANGTAALLAHSGQAELLRGSDQYVAGTVDEVLRYDAPVQLVARVAAADAVIAGTPVVADELVVAILGAGNRDSARFGDPDTFDITRAGSAPLSFGGGIHRCLGAPLARVQAGTFFVELLRRFPLLQMAGQPKRQSTVFRGFGYLPVALR